MSEGAILELVSRGKKDAYQIQNPQHTWFGSSYVQRSPSTREIRLLNPENPPHFGQWFDIVIPPDGDILMSFDLRITMPTWLPESIASINTQTFAHKVEVESHPYEVKSSPFVPQSLDPSANRIPYLYPPTRLQYGWCDGIANYLIGRWSLFVDNMVILTGYGEFNTWFSDLDTTHNIAPVIHASTGRINTSSVHEIQANATLHEMIFRVQLPGCQGKGDTGLPICAFRNRKLYIRFWLLDKTDLVISSEIPKLPYPPSTVGYTTLPMYELNPAPWGGRQIYINGKPAGKTLAEHHMGHPYIYARCAILNVDNELRASLQTQKFEIRFRQQIRDDWAVDKIQGSHYRRNLSLNGMFQSLFIGFRSVARNLQNKYTDVRPTTGDWLSALSLNVNGQDRILPWEPKKLKTLANNTQLKRDINIALYYLIFGISPDNEPGGACNLSLCQKAIMNMTFNANPIDPMTGTNITHGFVFGHAWNILDIVDGVAILRFSN